MDSSIRRKKHFGQHFLTNPETAERIVSFLEWKGAVVEIGPGDGILTDFLLSRGLDVRVVERDHELIPGLKRRFGSNLKIISADALDVMGNIPEAWGQTAVISNLPYNIASPLTFHFCRNVNQIPEMVLMYQREVAEKVTTDLGPLNLAVGPFFETNLVMTLKPASFSPPPKVDSAVVHFVRRKNFEVKPEKDYFRFCRRIFENRRKMLYKNIMKNQSGGMSEIFKKLEISRSARVDQLSVRQLLALYREVRENGIQI
ncbi:MAG: ribosomal RNA small subunit methyltransferase A [Acidobacteria bacterium]|nr:MAG: ribosomal RNA small subunit methyltransferase A [Acidobacteriota bacterium]